MAKRCYKFTAFRPKALATIRQADEILDEYTTQGLVVTVRQLYYQFVSRGLIPNTVKEYKKLADTVSAARLAGLLDWDAVEDRGRVASRPSEWASVREIADVAARQFRLPRWHDQPWYVELWVEKQALAGVLEPLTGRHHVTLMVNKGYSSQSAMLDSAKRFKRGVQQGPETRPILLYLGDLDPSGEDMVRDIRTRLEMFGVLDLTVEKLALTMDQVKKYKPPPNPAKITDPRFEAYRKVHGNQSWELDALDPPTLQKLVEDRIKALIDRIVLAKVVGAEERQRDELVRAAKSIAVESFDKRYKRCAFGNGCPSQESDLTWCEECEEWLCDSHDFMSTDPDGHRVSDHWSDSEPNDRDEHPCDDDNDEGGES